MHGEHVIVTYHMSTNIKQNTYTFDNNIGIKIACSSKWQATEHSDAFKVLINAKTCRQILPQKLGLFHRQTTRTDTAASTSSYLQEELEYGGDGFWTILNATINASQFQNKLP